MVVQAQDQSSPQKMHLDLDKEYGVSRSVITHGSCHPGEGGNWNVEQTNKKVELGICIHQ